MTNNHFTKEQEFEKHPKDEYRSVTQTHPLITSRPLRFYLLTLWTQLYSKLYIKDVKTRDSLIHLSSGSVGFRFLNLDICQFCLYMYDKLLSCFSVFGDGNLSSLRTRSVSCITAVPWSSDVCPTLGHMGKTIWEYGFITDHLIHSPTIALWV